MPRIERPRAAVPAAGRTGASEGPGQGRNSHPHLPGPFPQPKASTPWYRSNGWPTPAGHKGRRTGRQPATRGARRASRSLHSLLSQRPAHPTHRPGRARPRGPSRRRPAAVGVRNGCPDLPAGCLRAACHCSAACCWSSVCQPCLLGPCCSGCIPVRALVSPAALGGVWWCWGCRAWHWAGAETYFVVKI